MILHLEAPPTDWTHYHRSGEPRFRNRLTEAYENLVLKQARRIHSRLPSSVCIDDLIQAGSIGLLRAIEMFQPDHAVPFEAYCAVRVRGAILDELRSMDWLSRSARDRINQLERARNQFSALHGRAPSDLEAAKASGLDAPAYTRAVLTERRRTIASIDQPIGPEANSLTDIIPDERNDDPALQTEWQDLIDQMPTLFNEREMKLVDLYYRQGLTMEKVASSLKLSASRVSQIHQNIIETMRAIATGQSIPC